MREIPPYFTDISPIQRATKSARVKAIRPHLQKGKNRLSPRDSCAVAAGSKTFRCSTFLDR